MIRSLREGEVVTYGDIAEDAGYPKRSRLVGRILATTDERPARGGGSSTRSAGWCPATSANRLQLLRAEGVIVARWRRPDGAASVGSPVVRRSPLIDGGLDLHERQADVGQRVAAASAAPSPRRSPRPSTRQATASIARLASPRSWRHGAEMDRRQLVQPHHVVGDDASRRGPRRGEPARRGRLVRLVERRPVGVVPRPRRRRSSLLTCGTLPTTTEAKWGSCSPDHTAASPPDTCDRVSSVRPGHEHSTSAARPGRRSLRLRSCSAWLRSRTHQPDGRPPIAQE